MNTSNKLKWGDYLPVLIPSQKGYILLTYNNECIILLTKKTWFHNDSVLTFIEKELALRITQDVIRHKR